VRSRYLAAGAALWAAAYCFCYVAVIHSQGPDSSVAWWYVGIVLVAAAALSAGAAGVAHTVALTAGFALLVGATLLGLLSIGILLLPAVVAAGVAMVGDRREAAPA
jgi:hypothetical protein